MKNDLVNFVDFHHFERMEACCGLHELGDFDEDDARGTLEEVVRAFKEGLKEMYYTKKNIIATTHDQSQSTVVKILKEVGFTRLRYFTGNTGNKLSLWYRPKD